MATHPVGTIRPKSTMSRKSGQVYNADEEQSDQENSEINSLSGRKATPVGIKRVDVAPVGSAIPANASLETKELLARIDKLESEKAQMEEDKLELAKAVKDLNELLKEAKKQVQIQAKQIEDAEKQGAEILAAEVVEERNKIAIKRSKSIKKKGKGRKRANEVDEEEDQEEENEVFAENQELKKMVENLVPEEDRENPLQEAKSIMMVYDAKKEDLDKEIARLNKENDLLKKSLEELKKRNDENGGETLENLTEENRALISQIKNLKKQITELKEVNQQQQQNLKTQSRGDTSNNVEKTEQKEESNEEDVVTPIITNEVNAGPCSN